MSDEQDVQQIDQVLKAFAQQVVEGMKPVCKLYASIQNKELEQQLAQARALLMDWLPNEFSLRPGRAEALEKRTRAFLVQHKEEQP
jgi:hypothetical protein